MSNSRHVPLPNIVRSARVLRRGVPREVLASRGFLLAERSSSGAAGRHGDALAQQLVPEARHHTVVEVLADVAQVGRGALPRVGSLG